VREYGGVGFDVVDAEEVVARLVQIYLIHTLARSEKISVLAGKINNLYEKEGEPQNAPAATKHRAAKRAVWACFRALQGVVGCCRVLQGVVGCCRVL